MAIFASIGVSAGCLFYELYLKYIKKTAEPSKSEQAVHPEVNGSSLMIDATEDHIADLSP